MFRRVMLLLLGLATAAYPAIVYFTLDCLDPRWLLAGIAVLLAFRSLFFITRISWKTALIACALLMGLLGWQSFGRASVLWYPVIVNALFLLAFLWSLYHPPPVIERLARLTDPDLPPEGIAYTRKVTWVWCAFFLINGIIAAMTVWHADMEIWALYNGFLAYLFMGLLMAGEYVVRQKVKKSFNHA
ncbi:MAG: hypothetical protein AXA67_08320 [Methylothermaceae bacteria B42]|nr:MAG: hypothetical protein AXA67_08320 [Methylothermaceae bacteria B42]HHJ40461.1 hypothetical protein [Methylothermaceae bacterium]